MVFRLSFVKSVLSIVRVIEAAKQYNVLDYLSMSPVGTCR